MSEKSKQLGKEYIDSMLDPNGSFTQYGLTKREYFAGIAMQGLLANHNYSNNAEGLAKHSLIIAKAQIEAIDND